MNFSILLLSLILWAFIMKFVEAPLWVSLVGAIIIGAYSGSKGSKYDNKRNNS